MCIYANDFFVVFIIIFSVHHTVLCEAQAWNGNCVAFWLWIWLASWCWYLCLAHIHFIAIFCVCFVLISVIFFSRNENGKYYHILVCLNSEFCCCHCVWHNTFPVVAVSFSIVSFNRTQPFLFVWYRWAYSVWSEHHTIMHCANSRFIMQAARLRILTYR